MTLSDYIGNPMAYAHQNADGTYTPHREPLGAAELFSHQQGTVTLGTYVLDLDKARFFVFDVDDAANPAGTLPEAQRLASACKQRGFRPGVEFSGKKGYHVWVLLDRWQPAADVQRVAKELAAEVGFNGEVFPKQALARDLGSLVKLPGGVHRVTGSRSRWVGSEPVVVPGAFERFLATMAPLVPKAPTAGHGPLPCLESIQANPPGEGERQRCLFHFATHMTRAGLEGEQLESAVRTLNDRMKDPLDDVAVHDIVERADSSGPICDDIPPSRHCGEQCIKNRGGQLTTRRGELRHSPAGKNVVVTLGPPVPGSNTVELEHPDIEAGMARLRT